MTSNSQQSVSLEEIKLQLQSGNSMPEELLEVFSEEANDHSQSIYAGLARLKDNGSDREALAEVRRATHTLKGAAGAVDLVTATQLAHRMEDLLDLLVEENHQVSEDHLKLFLATADQLQDLTVGSPNIESASQCIVELYADYSRMMPAFNSVEPGVVEPEAVEATQSIIRQTAPAMPKTDPAKSSGPTQYLRVPLNRLNEMVSLMSEMVVNRSEFELRLNDFGSQIEDMHNALERLRTSYLDQGMPLAVAQNNNPQPASRLRTLIERSGANDEFDPLELDQYSNSYLQSQKLMEADNDTEIMSQEFRKLKSAFDGLLRRQKRLNRDAQDSLMRIRMVPLSGIVNRIERTVRTVAKKVGKQIELSIEGERVELDKTILDEITDPLLHLIRNAIDHGIEESHVRKNTGKSETAKITLSAVNDGTQVIIRISDDGGGINRDKILAKAIELGLADPSDELCDEDVYALIFKAGFSTASELTDVSGRGVGMDVVREAVRRLKGSVHIESKLGFGTTFSIQLPTTLGVAKALFVEACGKTFAIPMAAIQKVAKLESYKVEQIDDRTYVLDEGKKHRLVELKSHFQLTGKSSNGNSESSLPFLVISNGLETVALVVEEIAGSRDIAVKSLGNHLRSARGFNGATVSGDGVVIPILDSADLFASQKYSLRVEDNDFSPSLPQRKNIAMVVDDSISVRRITEKRLRFSGWEVVTAQDGVDALEKLAQMDPSPDVFLCDLEMPRMDGIELMRQIRLQQEFAATPIVMVTSRASEKHRHKAFDAGATEYVLKPYNEERLIALITDLVSSSRELVAN